MCKCLGEHWILVFETEQVHGVKQFFEAVLETTSRQWYVEPMHANNNIYFFSHKKHALVLDVGAESSDRETHKVQAWLQLAESREGEVSIGRIISEIPTIFVDETRKFGGL